MADVKYVESDSLNVSFTAVTQEGHLSKATRHRCITVTDVENDGVWDYYKLDNPKKGEFVYVVRDHALIPFIKQFGGKPAPWFRLFDDHSGETRDIDKLVDQNVKEIKLSAEKIFTEFKEAITLDKHDHYWETCSSEICFHTDGWGAQNPILGSYRSLAFLLTFVTQDNLSGVEINHEGYEYRFSAKSRLTPIQSKIKKVTDRIQGEKKAYRPWGTPTFDEPSYDESVEGTLLEEEDPESLYREPKIW